MNTISLFVKLNIGIIKRIVDPDSLQKTGSPSYLSFLIPITCIESPSIMNFAPMCSRASIVVLISSESRMFEMVLFPFDKAAHINALCDRLFEGGTFIFPFKELGNSFIWEFFVI